MGCKLFEAGYKKSEQEPTKNGPNKNVGKNSKFFFTDVAEKSR